MDLCPYEVGEGLGIRVFIAGKRKVPLVNCPLEGDEGVFFFFCWNGFNFDYGYQYEDVYNVNRIIAMNAKTIPKA